MPRRPDQRYGFVVENGTTPPGVAVFSLRPCERAGRGRGAVVRGLGTSGERSFSDPSDAGGLVLAMPALADVTTALTSGSLTAVESCAAAEACSDTVGAPLFRSVSRVAPRRNAAIPMASTAAASAT
jgi:hypothetical protein